MMVKPLWENFFEKLKLQKLSWLQVLSNDIHPNPTCMENCVILVAKYYLYQAHCKNERISVISCQNYISNYIESEGQIAKEKGKIALHKKKWSEYEGL